MSGSFEELDVPPTLVSFATAVGKVDRVTSPEFKGAGHAVYAVKPKYGAEGKRSVEASVPNNEASAGIGARLGGGGIVFQGGFAGSDLIPEPMSEGFAMNVIEELIGSRAALSVSTIGYGGAAEALFKMCVGNGIGFECDEGRRCGRAVRPLLMDRLSWRAPTERTRRACSRAVITKSS